MVDEHRDRHGAHARKIQRDLVQVFDQNVVAAGAQPSPHRAPGEQGEAVAAGDAVRLNPVQVRARRRAPPAARDEVNFVSRPHQPPEDLMQVNLRAPGMRILGVVPVDEQDPHSAPDSRATASSTPFTKAGALAPANQWASFTASSITTRGGVSPSASSASASRSEEHTSELQSRLHLVCRLLLEKKK